MQAAKFAKPKDRLDCGSNSGSGNADTSVVPGCVKQFCPKVTGPIRGKNAIRVADLPRGLSCSINATVPTRKLIVRPMLWPCYRFFPTGPLFVPPMVPAIVGQALMVICRPRPYLLACCALHPACGSRARLNGSNSKPSQNSDDGERRTILPTQGKHERP